MSIKLVDTLESMGNFPVANADGIQFTDGESLQKKLDDGSLGGGGSTAESYIELSEEEYFALSDEERASEVEYRTYDTGRIFKRGVEFGKETDISSKQDNLSQVKFTMRRNSASEGRYCLIGSSDLSQNLLMCEPYRFQGIFGDGTTSVENKSIIDFMVSFREGVENPDDVLSGFANSSKGFDFVDLLITADETTNTAYAYVDFKTSGSVATGEITKPVLEAESYMDFAESFELVDTYQGTLVCKMSDYCKVITEISDEVSDSTVWSSSKIAGELGKKASQTALVSNTPNLTLSITKNNPYWFGSFKLGYEYGSTPCEVTVTISSVVNYTVTKGRNTISKITYTQNDANYVFGIDFTATMYGTQVVEMPSEFGTINSLTNESFAGDTAATFKGYDGITYTTLAELGLTSSATIQNVMDALPVGGSCLIRTDAFDDTTQFMDVTWGYLKIEKTVNGLSKMEIYDVISDNKLYIGRQSSGKFNKWVALTTITSLSQLGLTADATLNDVIAQLGVGQTATLTTTDFTNYQTLFPYEEEQDAYATVRIEKGYDVNGSRTIVKWVRKDASKIAFTRCFVGNSFPFVIFGN